MTLQNLLGDLALDATVQDVDTSVQGVDASVQALNAQVQVLQAQVVALNESNALLRRVVKLLESSGNVDVGNRQRITLDLITSGLTLSAVTTVTNVTSIGGLDHRQFIDQARTAYNTGIRSQLVFD